MHIYFEKTINASSDSTILSMSWMGHIPDKLTEDEGIAMDPAHCSKKGWLAIGNVRGVVGVTYTTSDWKQYRFDQVPSRNNYNLRGHMSQITQVQWNEPLQILASCDNSGLVFVWKMSEGRWRIDKIKDRNVQITQLSWSHDGRKILICYKDNFAFIGGMLNERSWSKLFDIDVKLTCGAWSTDDQKVYFGMSNGHIVVFDGNGVMMSQVQLPSHAPISCMAWNCEKFKVEGNEDLTSPKKKLLLAVSFQMGWIYLLKSHDDPTPNYISTEMRGHRMEWSRCGEYLAVVGSKTIENSKEKEENSNTLDVYNQRGGRILSINIPHASAPVTSMTWGHHDNRIFIATGKLVHICIVSKETSLRILCRHAIYNSFGIERCVPHLLPLPPSIRDFINSLQSQTIPSRLSHMKDLTQFVTRPPSGKVRLYCKIIREKECVNQSAGTVYTLYLEHLGGLVPILKGKKVPKIRPEYVIYDPRTFKESTPTVSLGLKNNRSLCRRSSHREGMLQRELEEAWSYFHSLPEHKYPYLLVYNDVLPEAVRLVEITSNICGTKYKIHGVNPALPPNLGHLSYKTSVLHRQPRQLKLQMTDLGVPNGGSNSCAAMENFGVGANGDFDIGDNMACRPEGFTPMISKSSDNFTPCSALDPNIMGNPSLSSISVQPDLMNGKDCPATPGRREFLMNNIAPTWNEFSQQYELAYDGRSMRRSAKNMQIEFQGKQVMQFGKIDKSVYTLDFQYPLTPLQAFSVALTNLTQWFK